MALIVDYYNTNDDSGVTLDVNNWYGQTFTASDSYTISTIKVKVYANVSGTVTCSVYATSAGLPNGSALCSGTASSGDFDASPGSFYTFTPTTDYTLVKGTTYAIVLSMSGATSCGWRRDITSPTYTGGNAIFSANQGSSYSALATQDFMFEVYANLYPDDKTYSRKLFAIGGAEVWYESSAGTMEELTAADGETSPYNPLEAVELYQKIFIVNKTNMKVIDGINTKISTSDAGANPTTPEMELTGQTSGAIMIVDFADAVTDDAVANIYGKKTNVFSFTSGETVTGTNSDGNAVSFVLSANETAPDPPHWYDWTVFGADTTTYGTFLSNPTLVCGYRGRIVISGDSDYPQAWQMTKVGNPWKVLYDYTNDGDLSAVTYANNLVGHLGDIITALIPYKDDLLIFGCSNSIWLLVGDPLGSGQLAEITHNTGIWGARAWCIDNQKQLYFLGNDGIYRMPVGQTSSPPENISKTVLPNLLSDLDLDKSLHRVTLSFDPKNYGIIISKTAFTDGTNTNYFFSLLTGGYFLETYPASCGVVSSCFYPATDETYQKFLIGCQDGYIREFDNATKNDATTSSTSTISSYMTIIQQLSQDEFQYGMLREFSGILSGGASSGDFTDSDAVSWELHTAKDAETALENIKDGATAFTSGTWSTVGKQNKSRPRMRGIYAGIKLYNSTASQTWSLEKLYGNVEPKGHI